MTTENQQRDPELWAVAQRRVSFKYHLVTYLIMNGFFWLIWAFTGQHKEHNGLPWAIWPGIGWGIGLLFHFFGAYVFPKENSVEREYDKIVRNRK